ncbi:L-serine ammonia-lyase, iron-sulfur-dependent subunit beta [Clostridium sp. JN-9]|uniref:L-serine ammonia-lyase, iron-sulfur-dependent subunit beta n=1 Tax=Clostridium sp. JN-9 TaxID=2507159 RepID=UPI000FFE1EBF|nr:L-serine ammonia-lyase, iron-sulfur-dependent subunit beta [Clostridium sp. JN-9]QAT39024.1 L-serine ammonia-lyase, iron-sulfur-dependent, subunit beta [Clostridium sp. JN-9]
MREYSVFDILGPIMIGPSSSHTAGAARLGKIARIISDNDVKDVKFLLHGSFAKTYRGHGTDRALVAGILGMDPSDDRLKDSMEIARKEGITFEFIETDLGEVHPNTVKFIITKSDNSKIEVTGSSIGGGNIEIFEVDGESISFTGNYPTLIITHVDVPGAVSEVTSLLYKEKVNIAFMKVYRSKKGEKAIMVLETDSEVTEKVINEISKARNILSVRVINPARESE